MKSFVSRYFLLPVLAAATVLFISSRTYGQGGCLPFSSTHTIMYYQPEGGVVDTALEITNNTNSAVEVNVTYGPVPGDTEIVHLQSQGMGAGITLLPGQSWGAECEIYLLCPPTKVVYSAVIASESRNGTPCSFDTFTVYIQFPVTDSITLNVPTNPDTIGMAPDMALSAHKLRIVNSYPDDILLDSLSISSNVAYFGQSGNETFVFKDSLLAGQANDSAIMTVVPSDTGIQDIGLILHFDGGTQPYLIRDSVSQISLNGYHFQLGHSVSFRNLIPQQKSDSTLYFINTTPDTITITQFMMIDGPGSQWSIDTSAANNNGFPLRLPIILSPPQHIPITIGALDSGCDPITGSLLVIYSYSCGTDTAIFPLNGTEKEGTCYPFACISTVQSLDFGAVAAGDSVTQTLTLTNQSYDTVKVSLELGGNNAPQFTNLNQLTNPIIIPPNDSVDIRFTFTMPSISPQQNYSALLTAVEIPSNEYFICDTLSVPLTASLQSPSGVSNTATQQPVGFSLIPNPASGDVTILLPQNENATIDIYDVLGRMILSQQARGQYVWSGDTPNGVVTSGVYIVRVTEQGVDGTVSVLSKRLVFQR